MLTFNYGSPYFWDKVVLTKFISGCRMVWDLIFGTSWFYKLKTEKVTGGGMSAILPNWFCLLSITVLFTQPWLVPIGKVYEYRYKQQHVKKEFCLKNCSNLSLFEWIFLEIFKFLAISLEFAQVFLAHYNNFFLSIDQNFFFENKILPFIYSSIF